MAHAAGHGGDVVHIGLGHHGGHGGGHVAGAEFVFAVLVPQMRVVELRPDRALQGRHAALVRHHRGGLVVVRAAGAGEGVVQARIHVQLHAGLAAQRRQDALARLGRTEAVALGDVQHQPAAQPGRFLQAVLDADAVVAHGHVHVAAAGRQIGQLAAQAVAQRAHAALELGQRAQRHRRTDVAHAQILVEALVQREGARHVVRTVGQFDAGLLPPEQIRRQHHITFLGQPLGGLAHEAVQAEDLLAQHQAGAAARGRHGQIALELAAIMRGDADPPGRHVHTHVSLLLSLFKLGSKPLAPHKPMPRHPGRTEPAPPVRCGAPEGKRAALRGSTPFDKMRRTGPGTASAPCPRACSPACRPRQPR